jgi:diadenosine tetraphosphate (Ap4A) HIT family hydrolase
MGQTMELTIQSECPFCNLDNSRIILTNAYAIALYDGFPVSVGHSLIIPKRHIASFFEATREEQAALLDLLAEMQEVLVKKRNPDGFNIGINVGEAAGQTVMHLHIHLIPRYAGDQPDPRGGVRWIFPEKADYWSNRK